MAQVRIAFPGCGEVEPYSCACVQAMGDGVHLALCEVGHIRPLGDVLGQPPMGGCVGVALPGEVRIGNADLDREQLGHPFVLHPLYAPIIGQRVPQQRGPAPECCGEALVPRHRAGDTSASRPATDVIFGIWRGGPTRAPEADAPDAGRAAVRSAACHAATPTGSAGRWLPRSSGYARWSCPAICSGEHPSARCVRTDGHSQGSRNVHARDRRPRPALRAHSGAGCWALAATASPSPVANGQGPGPDSAAHGRVTQVRRACRWYGNTLAHQGRWCCTWS